MNFDVNYFLNSSISDCNDVIKCFKGVNIDLFDSCLTKLAFNVVEFYHLLINLAMHYRLQAAAVPYNVLIEKTQNLLILTPDLP